MPRGPAPVVAYQGFLAALRKEGPTAAFPMLSRKTRERFEAQAQVVNARTGGGLKKTAAALAFSSGFRLETPKSLEVAETANGRAVLALSYGNAQNERVVMVEEDGAWRLEIDAGAPAEDPTIGDGGTGPRIVALQVTEEGFEPAQIALRAKEPVVLRVTRVTENTCATEILVDGTSINVPLPLKTSVDVPYTPAGPGKFKFGCAMDKMIHGTFDVAP